MSSQSLSLSKRIGRVLNRRTQAGQSIVLLAIAMIGLIAFVGLVTDIAILFVRFSTLRRAIDAAAIAAASQMRTASDPSDETKQGPDYRNIVATAYQFIELHGIVRGDINQIFVETCESTLDLENPGLDGSYPGDPELCGTPRRKLVRVTAQIDSPTAFLSLFGWSSIRLQASAVGEAAVVDLALVLDTSESMSKETKYCTPGTEGCPLDDPDPNNTSYIRWVDGVGWQAIDMTGAKTTDYTYLSYTDEREFGTGMTPDERWGVFCNDPNADGWYDDLVCQPFKQVREAAVSFIENMLDFPRGDRVAIITFDRYPTLYDPGGGPWITDRDTARKTIIGEPGNLARPGIGIYRNPPSGDGEGAWNVCWTYYVEESTPYEMFAPCGNTNIGGGLRAGTLALNGIHLDGTDLGTKRDESLWVMVLLTDGAANVTDSPPGLSPGDYGYFGFCPESTLPPLSGQPFCRDDRAVTRHESCPAGADPATCDPYYDADDYARDWADSAALLDGGWGIQIFAIGLGDEVLRSDPADDPRHGEALLRYIADVGANGVRNGTGDDEEWWINGVLSHTIADPDYPAPPSDCESTPLGQYPVPPNPDPSCGNYFYAPDANGLINIFSEIASRIGTRVAR